MFKLIKINNKEKIILKVGRGKKTCSIRKDKGEADIRFLTENNASKATVDQPFKAQEGKTCQSRILSLAGHLSEVKAKERLFRDIEVERINPRRSV